MKKEKIYETILVIVAGLLVFYFIFRAKSLLLISFFLILLSLISRTLAEKIVWLWFKLSELMGSVMSKVLLTVIFYLFLTPIALLYRLIGKKDMLHLKRGNRNSNFVERDHQFTKDDLENPW